MTGLTLYIWDMSVNVNCSVHLGYVSESLLFISHVHLSKDQKKTYFKRRKRSSIVTRGKKKYSQPRLYNTRALTAALGLTDLASSGHSTPQDRSITPSLKTSPVGPSQSFVLPGNNVAIPTMKLHPAWLD